MTGWFTGRASLQRTQVGRTTGGRRATGIIPETEGRKDTSRQDHYWALGRARDCAESEEWRTKVIPCLLL